MTDKKKRQSSDNTVVILPGIYNETLQLLAEAHDYFFRHAESGQRDHTARESTMCASEMSRITVRLSCVMAWLMTRQAVFSGKLTEEDARRDFPLDCRDACLNQNIEAESVLPDAMTELLDKSYELYRRVARLDDLTGNS